jgi:Leucine-rich repeat (LRR) protein
MGLKELPSDFGQLTPNIRSINLNFNSLRDLRPLLNIKRLSELLLAGNKLERLRANAMVLGKLGTLSKLDWRDNPLSLRFYALASENRIMSLRQKPSDEQATDHFVLPDGDADADQQYLSRLDYETRIRRRVTEMMLANFCKNLRELDGLPFDKARVLVKDDVWERLLYLGVIQRKQPDSINEIDE